ncbi:MAG: hypothetical protein HFJ30_06215 [Clostridia bacterium]|jgi:hypothetical protein|nr:hypothetical protein [Clostridia bacterium]
MNKKTLMIAVAVIVAIVVIVGACVLLSSGKSSLKKEVVSQENYETILDEVGKKFGESDETYYYTYACIYHTAKAGFTDEYLQSKDESMLYKDITGKTVQQLIDEGKQLMEENNVTIEEYKQTLTELGGALAK